MNWLQEIEQAAVQAAKATAPAVDFDTTADEQQRTREWFLSRLGMFTNSKMDDLMKQGRGKDQLWGLTALSVIEKVIVERSMTPEGVQMYIDEMMYKEFRETSWGNKYEAAAREEFSNRTGLEVKQVGFIQSKELPFFGGSADGEVGVNPLEIKCPYNPLVHQKNLELLKTDIPKNHTYYAQIQAHLMQRPDADKCYFVSYDPRRIAPHDMAIIEVERDSVYVNALRDRLVEAEAMVVERLGI